LRRRKKKKRLFLISLLLAVALASAWWVRSRQVYFMYFPAFGIDIPTKYPIHGIDISKYQGKIDWDEVKKIQAGEVKINFVFIKATEGITGQDDNFQQNWKNAKKAGLLRGAYHYFYSTRDPRLQARNFIQQVKLQPGDLPPVLDIQISNDQPDSIIQNTAKIWLETVQRAFGVRPIIYTNIRFYERHLGDAFNDYPLWISHYYQDQRPATARRWLFWQHSDSGQVNGIGTRVDFNVFNGDSADLMKLCVP